MTNRAENWPLYRGTKVLKATPMTKADYCLLRAWSVPANEDPTERGYTVEYQDGGAPNLPDFAGYVSWSPADVFEKAYQRCGTHIERMELERAELADRIEKLVAFMSTPVFAAMLVTKQHWMKKQYNAMDEYLSALRNRLSLEAVAENITQG